MFLSKFGDDPCMCKHGNSPPNFRGDLKISDQNNWRRGGAEQKIKCTP